MVRPGKDSMQTRQTLHVDGQDYDFFSIKKAMDSIGDVTRLPKTLKVLLENLLRFEDGGSVKQDDVKALKTWLDDKTSQHEIAYRPARVLMQDFTGVPAVVDLAAMREAMKALGNDPQKINPLSAVDLVIDHSVMVDEFGTPQAFQANVEREFSRNGERYAFLNWGQKAFQNFRVVPPGTGICHQVNLEYLAQTVWVEEDENNPGRRIAYPDTLVGTDSHTTMVNGLGVLGWGVGGIEAEAAMLGQPVSMVIPEVIGFKLTGALREGSTATDLVLTVTQMLRERGVVGKFVEFFGDGIAHMSVPDRATLGNMAPEFGSTCGFFPIDDETIRYLRFTGRDEHRVKLVEAYAKEQGLWREDNEEDPIFTDTLHLDLADVEPSLAGPKRPQDRILLSQAADSFKTVCHEDKAQEVQGESYNLNNGDIVIAAITSCTNTSNPSVMLAAGLVARNAVKKGLNRKPWVKTSLAPGSQVVTEYFEKSGLQNYLDQLGFDLVGYGCTTCIGNSGPLPDNIAQSIEKADLTVCSVLSGNRNFEGRISPHVKANYLASPPLVVAYALAGSMNIDIYRDPIGQDKDGHDVYLKDIWPSNAEVHEYVEKSLTPQMYTGRYANVFDGTSEWQAIGSDQDGETYAWDDLSTYVKNPPFFDGIANDDNQTTKVCDARCLALLGDSVTTDHISPAGAIKKDSPAGKYLLDHGVEVSAFNSFGSRRGNHEVMMRGTFANIRIQNEMTPDVTGGYTKYVPDDEVMPIYDAAMKYQKDGTSLIVIAGKEYGTGSSRDWAAKGTNLLGVKAVIAESFERIHRSNLIGMGVLPLQFKNGETRKTCGLTGFETFGLEMKEAEITPRGDVTLVIRDDNDQERRVTLLCRIDTDDEAQYYSNGGILHYVLHNLAEQG